MMRLGSHGLLMMDGIGRLDVVAAGDGDGGAGGDVPTSRHNHLRIRIEDLHLCSRGIRLLAAKKWPYVIE